MPNLTDPSRTRCSLLLFLATPSEEEGLVAAAQDRQLGFEKVNHPELGKYLWFGQVGSETVIASRPWREEGRVVIGSHGRLGTAARGISLREKTGAQGIIQMGMAFGVDPGTQQLGDVVVSSSLIAYDNRIVPSDSSHPSGYSIDYRAATPQPARQPLVDLFQAEAEKDHHPFQIHIGAMLSGAARIHSRKFRDELVLGVPNGKEVIVGGEMEGVGLLAASRAAKKPIWCIVKGISDFADEDRDSIIEQWRVPACRNAAQLVIAALQNGSLRP